MRALSLVVVLAASSGWSDDGTFGQSAPALGQFIGRLHFLPAGTAALPASFAALPVEGVLWADRLDVSQRSFTLGFPGVTRRTEWFALDFEGSFVVDAPGVYGFRLHSDDGAKLWVDDAVVIDHDGLHAPTSRAGTVTLSPGPHRLRVAYFQGPAQEVALQLFVTPPGLKERVFVITEFARQRLAVLRRLEATPTRDGTLVTLAASKLFVTGKTEFSKDAKAVLDDVAVALKDTPKAVLTLSGLSAPGTSDETKPSLSEARVVALERALAERDTGGARLVDKGWSNKPTQGTTFELLIGQ